MSCPEIIIIMATVSYLSNKEQGHPSYTTDKWETLRQGKPYLRRGVIYKSREYSSPPSVLEAQDTARLV